jgi:2-amino-4-hydroxy-6-hydroxymethyldihydropteridine diphosphokinase
MLDKQAYILLGSNLGNRSGFLKAAIKAIEKQCGIVLKKSSIYETEPWGVIQQPSYLNQVIEINTLLEPEQLLQVLLAIETQLGRIRTTRFAERTIDIDILFINDSIIESTTLTVPHPAMSQRRFVLLPLHEIAPELIHPITRLSITEMLECCSDTLKVEKIENPT